ncbi:MAG TPA: acetyl ornithine aminotransferase family protein [Candidatus Bathyarchaeota archaeon]|nr:acetyl ornithine aminotransferase family protein [Candidatus Bathyarchaeota archaeon]
MSEAKYPKIVVPPPGPKALAAIEKDQKYLPPYNRPFYYPIVVESARDCIVRDVDGNEYIDFNSGLVVCNVGHSHPKLVEAVEKQLRKLIHYSYTDFYYPYTADLAEKLTEIVPGNFPKKVFFSNSGAESIEAAIKVAKWHTRKPQFIAFIGAFHGRTMGAISFTASKPVQRKYFFPLMPGVTHVPYPYCYRCPFRLEYPDCGYWCVDFIEEEVLEKFVPPEEVAAVLIETIQGEGGYVVPPPEYHQRLKKLCEKHGILFIADEVQSGMGRTGRWFAIEHWGVAPDIVCMAKGIAGGVPLGATVARADVMDWEAGAHCTTFGGNPVSCVAAMAVIDIIREENLLENAQKQGEYIMKFFNDLKEEVELIGDVRGKGLMIGVELVKDRETKEPAEKEVKEVITRSWKRGVVVITCGDSTIRIAPPLTITRELVDTALEIISGVLREVDRERKTY